MKKLYLRLNETTGDAPVEFVSFDEQGRRLEYGRALLSELAERAGGAAVHAVLPACELAHVLAKLPPLPAVKIRSSLPFALEDQLVDDCEALHFAFAPLEGGHTMRREQAQDLSVAVISHARLRSWLELLRAAGLAASKVYGEQSILFARPTTAITLAVEPTRTLIVRPPSATLETPPERLTDNLVVWLALQEFGAGASTEIALVGTPEHLDAIAPSIATAMADPRLTGGAALTLTRHETSAYFCWLAEQAEGQAPIDLLQGEYEPPAPAQTHWQRWRLPAWLAAATVALFIVDVVVDRWSARAAVDSPYVAAAPASPAAVDPLFVVLEALASDAARSGLRLEELQLESAQRVRLVAQLDTLDELANIETALAQRGYVATTTVLDESERRVLISLAVGERAADATVLPPATRERVSAWVRSTGLPTEQLRLLDLRDDTRATVRIESSFDEFVALLESLPREQLTLAEATLRKAPAEGQVQGDLLLLSAR